MNWNLQLCRMHPPVELVEAYALEAGKKAHQDGRARSPSIDPECRRLVCEQAPNHPGTIMRAWLRGWDQEDFRELAAAMRET